MLGRSHRVGWWVALKSLPRTGGEGREGLAGWEKWVEWAE